MDYAPLAEYHWAHEADVTVAVTPVSPLDAHRFGILKMEPAGRITDFIEKPQKADVLAGFASRDDAERPFLGSMGIYLFKTSVLVDLLNSDLDDFGRDVLPAAIRTNRVFGYGFDGYWEDIGTMRTFYDANLGLTKPNPPFSFHDPVRPVYTHPRFLPGSRIYDVQLDNVLLADGSIVEGAEIHSSIIGVRSVIGEDVLIRETVIMGADYYEEELRGVPGGLPPMGIGRGTRICGAIIDKNARIGPNVRIECFPRGTDLDEDQWTVRDGIVVVPKNSVIPAGTVIAPGS
jgi:glucose-1-phosphate adenylyltransferase